jgi:hypothetical protein
MWLPLAVGAVSSFDVETSTFSIDRMKIKDSPQEYRDLVIKFTSLDGMDIKEATPQPEFYGEYFYTSSIAFFNGLVKHDLFELNNELIFKVVDDVSIPYTEVNQVVLYRRNDNTWFASMGRKYFNVEPFVYGNRVLVDCRTLSSNGKIITDQNGNYWRITNNYGSITTGDYITVYNDNVTLVRGRTISVEKF